uniref:Uncharacterized protein n=1 Tax=Euplotes crassus TaxID=5936 RepID=A0A7S3KC61_EUPCR
MSKPVLAHDSLDYLQLHSALFHPDLLQIGSEVLFLRKTFDQVFEVELVVGPVAVTLSSSSIQIQHFESAAFELASEVRNGWKAKLAMLEPEPLHGFVGAYKHY